MCVRACALALLSVVVSVHALQFDLDIGRSKCIGEVMSKHEVAKGKYTVIGAVEGQKTSVDIKITGPGGENEFSTADASSGPFAFTATDAGAHKVCFTNGGNSVRRIDLDFNAGLATKDYSDLAKKEHLKPLELELRKLEDRVDGIYAEMQYQKEREERHRNTNESTNARVVGYSLLTIAVVFSVSVAQAVYLYTYLKRKRLL